MKKVLYTSLAVVAIAVSSCGSPDLCECQEKIMKAKDMEELKDMEDCVTLVKDAKPEDLEACLKKDGEEKKD
jgi:hypothetical protein